MKRLALFARSSNHRRLDEQLERCRRVAAQKGLAFEDALTLRDICVRAATPVTQRPAYESLLDSIRRGRCDVVVVDEVIVLTSDFEELAELLTLVRAGAVRLVTADGVDTGKLARR